ncbi:MAG: glycosyltransferase [Pirellulaceae bacterium]
MRSTIVIAAHNEGSLLGKTIDSVKQTLNLLDAEIVVVDDASTDGAVEEVQRKHPDINVESFPERVGVSRTKDRGARVAKGEVVVFLDGHCKPEPDAILRLVEDVEISGGDAVITPGICPLDPETWQNKTNQIGHGYQVRLDTLEANWQKLDELRSARLNGSRVVHETPTFMGCVVAMSRHLYARLHGFDTDMLSWGSEDVDLGIASWLLGHPVYHDPVPLVGHRFQQSFKKYPVPAGHALANQLRMARKTFSEEVWREWLPWFRGRQPRDHWDESWRVFCDRWDSVERERQYLLANRIHDEFWYSRRFALTWPLSDGFALSTSNDSPTPSLGKPSDVPPERPDHDPDPRPSRPPSPTPPPPTSPSPSPSPSPMPS